MQYEPPAINFPVRKESPQELREGEAAWSCRVALGPGSRSRVSVAHRCGGRTLAWPGYETGDRCTPLGQTHIKQGNRRQGRGQKPRY
jgi:hypothetical protein